MLAAASGVSALVLFSGGQDSTACLAWALARYERVETIGFDYGQRHLIEMECRLRILQKIRSDFPQWAHKLGEDHVLPIPVLGAMSETSLTREVEIHMSSSGLPDTFVPGRNLLFLTLAAALAYRRGLTALVTGVCETDYSGYPDCRDATMRAMEHTLNLGMEAHFEIHTPLMWLTKAQTWELAQQLGGTPLIDLILEDSHSCYMGEHSTRHAWGYGCGSCPACELRAHGWHTWQRDQSAPLPASPPA